MVLIRRFRLEDAEATRAVFVQAVMVGAVGRYTPAELAEWIPDPALSDNWGPWLDGHYTLVAEDQGRVQGFMMIEADGYLNMAFVRPEVMGKGVALVLYQGILAHAQGLSLRRLRVLASRYAEGFFARQGWARTDPQPKDESDPPMSCEMALDLGAAP
jgi:putative acetyltransferase